MDFRVLRSAALCCAALAFWSIGDVSWAAVGDLIRTFPNPDPGSDDRFGLSIAPMGNNFLVGAPRDDTFGQDAGAAYLFGPSGNLLSTFGSPTPNDGDWFGWSVQAVGDKILVGSIRDDTWDEDAGAAYLFNQSGQLLTTFFSPNPGRLDSFGNSLAVVGDDILVGAYRQQDPVTGAFDSGAAYLYSQHGTLLQSFANPTPATSDQFGYSLAGVGDKIVIGAAGDDTTARGSGAAYVFEKTGELFTTIHNPTPAENDSFGISVAALNNDILVGANLDDTRGENAGAVYRFDLDGNLISSIFSPVASGTDNFGLDVVGAGDHILVSATGFGNGLFPTGAAFLFDGSGTLVDRIDNPSPSPNQNFAGDIAAVGNSILISAPLASVGGASNSGAVYLFEGAIPPQLLGDTDLDGDVDAQDFAVIKANLARKGMGLANGDINGDGEVDLRDFSALKANFGITLSTRGSGNAVVPEPSTYCLLLLGVIGALLPVVRARCQRR